MTSWDAAQDVFHLGCMGLKKVPEGEWVCPSCTIASGATGTAAAAAISAASRRSRAPRGEGRSRNPRAPSVRVSAVLCSVPYAWPRVLVRARSTVSNYPVETMEHEFKKMR